MTQTAHHLIIATELLQFFDSFFFLVSRLKIVWEQSFSSNFTVDLNYAKENYYKIIEKRFKWNIPIRTANISDLTDHKVHNLKSFAVFTESPNFEQKKKKIDRITFNWNND